MNKFFKIFAINFLFLMLSSFISANAITAVVVNSVVKKGEIIRLSDVSESEIQQKRITPDVAQDISKVVGMQALRHLRPGMTVRMSFIREKPLVQKDQKVKAVFNKPGIRLESTMVATQDGSKDQVIKIRNIDSKKDVMATVIGDNTVSVN